MEEDFLVTSLGLLPGEGQRNAFLEGSRSVTMEGYLSILANHLLVLFDLLGSHASASPQGLLGSAVVL